MTGLSRRRALLGGLTFAAAVASPIKPVLADPGQRLPAIQDRIAALERRHNANVGLFAVDLDGDRSIAHRSEEAFAMCSTFKGYASARVLQMVEQGELTLDQQVFVDDCHRTCSEVHLAMKSQCLDPHGKNVLQE